MFPRLEMASLGFEVYLSRLVVDIFPNTANFSTILLVQ